MPGTVRSTSVSVVEPVLWMTSCGMTVIERGVSRSGSGFLIDDEVSALKPLSPVTVTCGRSTGLGACCAATGAAATAAPTMPASLGMARDRPWLIFVVIAEYCTFRLG